METQLFYCNSRYYSPELCRWISPDSIEYLDPESINGLNFVNSLAGNYLGGKMILTNPGWFQPQKFLSVFTKSYGQKFLLQTAIGAGLSGTVNFIRKKLLD